VKFQFGASVSALGGAPAHHPAGHVPVGGMLPHDHARVSALSVRFMIDSLFKSECASFSGRKRLSHEYESHWTYPDVGGFAFLRLIFGARRHHAA
jgi:hypothetical protein